MRRLTTIILVVLSVSTGINAFSQAENDRLFNTLMSLLASPKTNSNLKQLSYSNKNNNNFNSDNFNSYPVVRTLSSANSLQQQQPVLDTGIGSYQTQSYQVSEDQIVDACQSNPCLNEGVCTSSGNVNYVCSCPWGWTGTNCEICLTDCASNPCPSNKQCVAKFGGGFDCLCPRNRKGPNCEQENDACLANPCLNSGECHLELGGKFSCSCLQPFDGLMCDKAWLNPCTTEVLRNPKITQFRNPWNKNSYLICYDIDKFHVMPCPSGTFFNDRLKHCVPDGYNPPDCLPGFCQNEGECILDEMNEPKCFCRRGFGGERCEINNDECAAGGNQACAGGTCVDQVNGFYCQCPSGIGLDCVQTVPNPCTVENLEAEFPLGYHEFPTATGDSYIHCTDVGRFVIAKCPSGLFWNQEEQACSTSRPIRRLRGSACAKLPCRNGATCVERNATEYECECKQGYIGDHCEQMIDFCESNPCSNGGRCLGYAGGYTCVCPDKVVDECCCHGVTNPCPPRAKLVPGVNNYFPHLFSHRYIHCDFEGRAFVRNCAHGLKWYQDALGCLSDNHVKTFLASQLESGPSYGTVPPISQDNGAQYGPSSYSGTYNRVNAPIKNPVQPIVQKDQPSYGQSQQVIQQDQPAYGQSQQKVQQDQPSYGQSQQVIQQDQPSYGQSQQVIQQDQPSYGQSQQVIQQDQQKFDLSQSSSTSDPRPYVYGNVKSSYSQNEATFGSHYNDMSEPIDMIQTSTGTNNSPIPASFPSSFNDIAEKLKMTPEQFMQIFAAGGITQTTEHVRTDTKTHKKTQNMETSTQQVVQQNMPAIQPQVFVMPSTSNVMQMPNQVSMPMNFANMIPISPNVMINQVKPSSAGITKLSGSLNPSKYTFYPSAFTFNNPGKLGRIFL